jgi:hypothetical protein
MDDFFNQIISLQPGYLVAIICAGLAILLSLSLVFHWLFHARWSTMRWRKNKPVLQAETAPEKAAPVSSVAQVHSQGSVTDALMPLVEAMQLSMRGQLQILEADLELDRVTAEQNAEKLRRQALDQQLPMTLFELYVGMRTFSRKKPEAQEIDLEWHAKAGISDIVVRPLQQEQEGVRINFCIDRKPLILWARQHRYSRTEFLEMTLFDSMDNPVFIVRIKHDRLERELTSQAVTSYTPGEWLAQILSCRIRMDARAEELVLRAKYREVEQLKRNFSLDPMASGQNKKISA